jgi:hypothetical protein
LKAYLLKQFSLGLFATGEALGLLRPSCGFTFCLGLDALQRGSGLLGRDFDLKIKFVFYEVGTSESCGFANLGERIIEQVGHCTLLYMDRIFSKASTH